MGRTRAHIRYKLKDGQTIVPGITTVLAVLNKPALVPWANRLGLQGIDVRRYVDDKAAIGTLAHKMVTDYLQGGGADGCADYSPNQVAAAENSFLSFLEWEKRNPVAKPVIFVERPLVHEELRFGGTADIYGLVNGRAELIELKTGAGIWPEHVYQSAANRLLLEYHGHRVAQVRIVNIPRTDDESFSDKVCSARELAAGEKIFLACLQIFNWQKEK